MERLTYYTLDSLKCLICGKEMKAESRAETFASDLVCRKITWAWECECGKKYKQIRLYNKQGLVFTDTIKVVK